MTIQHNLITGTDLHEPKGVAAAAANKVYVANGSASGAWSTLTTSTMTLPKGKFWFYNISSAYNLTYGAATQKVAPTTIASGLGSLVTEATSARLTYTGALTTVVKLDFDVSLGQSTGSNKDLTIAIHKNGAVIAGSEQFVSTTSSEIHVATGSTIVTAATNDYFEIYAFNTDGAGTMSFYKVGLTLTST